MSEELKTVLFVLLAVLIIAGLMRSSWRLLKKSERMLDNVDKSKLRDYDDE